MQQRPDLQILELRVGEVDGELAELAGEPRLVHDLIAAPVEEDIQHRLLVVAHEACEQVDDLTATRRRQPTHHAEIDQGETIAR